MPRLIWSPEALADVQRLYRFFAAKNPDATRRAASAIRDGMQIIADHPDVGRPVDDMDPEFQEWPISFGASGYVALYLCRKTWLWSSWCVTRKRLAINLHRPSRAFKKRWFWELCAGACPRQRQNRWSEIRAHQGTGPPRPGRHGKSRHIGRRTLQRTKNPTRHPLQIRRPKRKLAGIWKTRA